MDHTEFRLRAIAYLTAQFPEMERKLATTEQVNRWYQRFGHLDYVAWCRAVDAYADDNRYAPTVNGLAVCLPQGSGARRALHTCQHAWITLGDGNQSCQHCGRCHDDCMCPICRCRKELQHAGWYHLPNGDAWCERCRSILVAKSKGAYALEATT